MRNLTSPVHPPHIPSCSDVKREISRESQYLITAIENVFDKYINATLSVEKISKLVNEHEEKIEEINQMEGCDIDHELYKNLEHSYIFSMAKFSISSEHTYSHGCFVGPSPLLTKLLEHKFWANYKTYVYE